MHQNNGFNPAIKLYLFAELIKKLGVRCAHIAGYLEGYAMKNLSNVVAVRRQTNALVTLQK